MPNETLLWLSLVISPYQDIFVVGCGIIFAIAIYILACTFIPKGDNRIIPLLFFLCSIGIAYASSQSFNKRINLEKQKRYHNIEVFNSIAQKEVTPFNIKELECFSSFKEKQLKDFENKNHNAFKEYMNVCVNG